MEPGELLCWNKKCVQLYTKTPKGIYIYIYILLILPCIGVEGDLFGAKIKKQQYI